MTDRSAPPIGSLAGHGSLACAMRLRPDGSLAGADDLSWNGRLLPWRPPARSGSGRPIDPDLAELARRARLLAAEFRPWAARVAPVMLERARPHAPGVLVSLSLQILARAGQPSINASVLSIKGRQMHLTLTDWQVPLVPVRTWARENDIPFAPELEQVTALSLALFDG